MAYRVGTQKGKKRIMNTPTKITVSRIVLIVLMLVVLFVLALIPNLTIPDIGNSGINWAYLVIFIVFVIAAFTDFLDGYLARKNNQVTNLGKFLDPIADKLLVNSMLIFLLIPQSYAVSQHHENPALTILGFCVILMIIRDLVVDMIRFMAVKNNKVIAANIFGKIKTVLQMIAIPMMLLNDWPFSYFDSSWPEALRISHIFFYFATIMSVLSGIIYVVQNLSVLKEEPKDEKSPQ